MDKLVEEEELRWTFKKTSQQVGIYSDFQTLHPDHPTVRKIHGLNIIIIIQILYM